MKVLEFANPKNEEKLALFLNSHEPIEEAEEEEKIDPSFGTTQGSKQLEWFSEYFMFT